MMFADVVRVSHISGKANEKFALAMQVPRVSAWEYKGYHCVALNLIGRASVSRKRVWNWDWGVRSRGEFDWIGGVGWLVPKREDLLNDLHLAVPSIKCREIDSWGSPTEDHADGIYSYFPAKGHLESASRCSGLFSSSLGPILRGIRSLPRFYQGIISNSCLFFDCTPLPNGCPPETAGEHQQDKSSQLLKPDGRTLRLRGWIIVAIAVVSGFCGGWFGTEFIAQRRYWDGLGVLLLCGGIFFVCLMMVW